MLGLAFNREAGAAAAAAGVTVVAGGAVAAGTAGADGTSACALAVGSDVDDEAVADPAVVVVEGWLGTLTRS